MAGARQPVPVASGPPRNTSAIPRELLCTPLFVDVSRSCIRQAVSIEFSLPIDLERMPTFDGAISAV